MERTKIEAFASAARNLLRSQIKTRIELLRKSESSAVVIENSGAIKTLEENIAKNGIDNVVEEVSYTWFNRLCALRYMDAHDFNRPMIVTPLEGETLPEILSDAMTGSLDSTILSKTNEEKINKLLSGEIKSNNAQAEIYRILLVSKCNELNKSIPKLFEYISDYTELLLPDDLLSKDDFLYIMREALTDDNCKTVEVIGWLYQYYISEKKDEVFAGFKKNKKATSKEIPAATQLFTPEWIVRYLVENSLGRLWMLNHPESRLIESMKYYVKPVDIEPDFIRIKNPEEIKLCDPCCGSGHMLTYAFDILFEIYSELGYTSKDAVEHILKDNLYGIEIDERAGQLAYFALNMKAREKVRRFFSLQIEPNICVLNNVIFDDEELEIASNFFANKNKTEVKNLLSQFDHADTFGSLIIPAISDIPTLRQKLTITKKGDLFDSTEEIESKVNKVLDYSEYLSSRYHVVVTNPPYMSKYDDLFKSFLIKNYPDSKTDLCTAFMERDLRLILPYGYSAMVNMQSWMFLSSYEKLRLKLLKEKIILSMAHIGTKGFDSIGGEVVSTTAFVLSKKPTKKIIKGEYFRLVDTQSEAGKSKAFLEAINNHNHDYYFEVSAEQFEKIPGSPIAYWASDAIFSLFATAEPIIGSLQPYQGLATADNGRFLRLWWEISPQNVCYTATSCEDALATHKKWFPYQKGGAYRKWYGNNDYLVNWENDGYEIKNFVDDKGKQRSVVRNPKSYFKQAISWSKISSGILAFRYRLCGSIYDVAGPSMFGNVFFLKYVLGFVNSTVALTIADFMSPTLNYEVGQVSRYPLIFDESKQLQEVGLVDDAISLSKSDWDSFETSWDFVRHPLLEDRGRGLISECYERYKEKTNEAFFKLKENEEELNRIFIDIYGLQDELKPEEDDSMVSVHRIFDSDSDIPQSMRKGNYALTKKDVVKSFISYAVACMFGRYSLDSDGLAFAGGDWDGSKYKSFVPDEDNVITVLSSEWFADDIVSRFREFVKACFGQENLSLNMRFVEDALGMTVRGYFLKSFYEDHVRTYQKRPIYWMFSSPKGYFNALIYLHRYNENTPSIVLRYLRQFRSKISSEISVLQEDKNNERQVQEYKRILDDLDSYEQILYPIAMNNIQLDLDDGVKVNYLKLGNALRKVPGLEKKE